MRLKELASMNSLAAHEIKTELDKQYGIYNYIRSKDILDSPKNLVCLPIDKIMSNKFQSSHIKDLLEFSSYNNIFVIFL